MRMVVWGQGGFKFLGLQRGTLTPPFKTTPSRGPEIYQKLPNDPPVEHVSSLFRVPVSYEEMFSVLITVE